MAVSIIRPTADSAVTWTRSAGADNYALIDETSKDDDGTYNYTSDDPNRDLFTGDDLNIPGAATITGVVLKMYARKADGQALNIGFSWAHDSTVNETSFALTTGYVLYTEDISASEAWQPGDFDSDGFKFGYYHDQSQSREARVTMYWVEVTWSDGGIIIQQAIAVT
jgi:hypothetical protein